MLPDTDVDDVWDRFEVFEALHHTMQICNPMTDGQLDEVVASLPLSRDTVVLDVACGYGEVLFRAAARADVKGLGIDLSPWMISSAHAMATSRAPRANLQWVLGEASGYEPPEPPDVCICIGAEWIWHDFNGTARSLSGLLGDGGVAVIGAARLHHGAEQAKVAATHGRVETIDDMAAMLNEHGLRPLHRIDPDDADWDRYLDRTAGAAQAWAERHPGERAEQWLAEQADWHAARERDRNLIGWSLWVAGKEH